jgi:hypothetical protein
VVPQRDDDLDQSCGELCLLRLEVGGEQVAEDGLGGKERPLEVGRDGVDRRGQVGHRLLHQLDLLRRHATSPPVLRRPASVRTERRGREQFVGGRGSVVECDQMMAQA